MNTNDDVLTIDELAEYLKLSKSTLYKLAQERKVPGQKIGKHWRFHRDAIDDWLRGDSQCRIAARPEDSSTRDAREGSLGDPHGRV